MTWNIFRPKSTRDSPRVSTSSSGSRSSSSRKHQNDSRRSSSPSSHTRRQSQMSIPSPLSSSVMIERPHLDPESNPLSGTTTVGQFSLIGKTLSAQASGNTTRHRSSVSSQADGSAKLGPSLFPREGKPERPAKQYSNNSNNGRTNVSLSALAGTQAVSESPGGASIQSAMTTVSNSTMISPKTTPMEPNTSSSPHPDRPKRQESMSLRSDSSSRSGRNSGPTGARSIRSVGHGSFRSRHIKAAHAAKRASIKYIAAKCGEPLICYTCGNEFFEVHCKSCQTAYVPPDFKFSASSAALFGDLMGGDAFSSSLPTSPRWQGSPVMQSPPQPATSAASISGISDSGVSTSGATVFLGFYPDIDNDDQEPSSTLDLELIHDLASCNEAGLLETVLFECFCNVDAVVEAFYRVGKKSDTALRTLDMNTLSRNGVTTAEKPITNSPSDASDTDYESMIDSISVQKMYDVLSTVTSTAPIRGILQGAQAVLQNRQHEPISERELLYICIILQCPAIADCSMFTKIMGPMQKLSRYASLRSRARVILEVSSGLITHAPEAFHLKFMKIFSELDIKAVENLVDLCNGYISHRLSFDFHYKSGTDTQPNKFQLVKHDWYADDWRIVVVVKFMALLWGSNSCSKKESNGIPLPHFYNMMVDLVDLKADFDSWQSKTKRLRPQFSFCRYPFLISVGSKARVLTHAIQREVNLAIQLELFAILANTPATQSDAIQHSEVMKLRTFTLRVRRQHIFEDSMEQLIKWPSSKRRQLRVEFDGEPGIDAGGLKKEWFLLFYRGLFNPALNIFKMDESSNYCWFSPTANLDYCRVAGTTLGLALFNSITIDFNLPLLLFKLLLDAPYDFSDIGTLWPDVTQSFQSILDYEDLDFEEVFGLTFTAPDGTCLIADGDKINVTSSSRDTYVNLMIDYFVRPQGEPFQCFKEAFLSVCGGNAITLFQPEELELLVRGDRQPFDVAALRSVTKYVNFGHRYERANKEPVVQWFWAYFEKLDPAAQARLLQFITATDRAPAAGMVQMRFSIMCLGSDSERLPIAHTCFNQLCLYKYKSRAKLEKKLSLAIQEYQGFGLK